MNLDSINNHYKNKYLKYKKKYLNINGGNKKKNKKQNNTSNKKQNIISSKFQLIPDYKSRKYLNNIDNANYFLSLLEICFENDNDEQFNLNNVNLNNWILLMDNEEIIGCLSYDFNDDLSIKISNVCNFSSKYRGICKYLVSNFLIMYQNNYYYLYVNNNNIGAIRCYESCGFQKISEENNIIKMLCEKKNIIVFDDSIIKEINNENIMKGGFQILLDRNMLNNLHKLNHSKYKEERDCILCSLYYLGIKNIDDFVQTLESNSLIDEIQYFNKIIKYINYLKKHKPNNIIYDENQGKDLTIDDLKYEDYYLYYNKEFKSDYFSEIDNVIMINKDMNSINKYLNSKLFRYKVEKDFEDFVDFIDNGEELNERFNKFEEIYKKWCYRILTTIFQKINPGFATFLNIHYKGNIVSEEKSIPPKIGEYGYFSYDMQQDNYDKFEVFIESNNNKLINKEVHYSMKNNISNEDDYNVGKIHDITSLPHYNYKKSDVLGHMLIIFKDINNYVYFIDNQSGEVYKGFEDIYENYIKYFGIEYFKIINTKIYLKPIENPNKTPSNYTSIKHSKFKKQQKILNNVKTTEDIQKQYGSIENIQTQIELLQELQNLLQTVENPRPSETPVNLE